MFQGNNLPASPEDIISSQYSQNSMLDDAKQEKKSTGCGDMIPPILHLSTRVGVRSASHPTCFDPGATGTTTH